MESATAERRIQRQSPDGTQAERRLWGLVTRRARWGLSLRGWLALVAAVTLCGWVAMLNAFSFLAVNEPVQTEVLVVEGWLDNWAFPMAAAEFKRGGYKLLLCTGGPVPGTGGYTNDFNTVASVGAERLIAAGIARELVHIVPSRESARDRTYASARAMGRWFQDNGLHVRKLNVLTQTTHARRTRFLFQEALGPETKVGIIPVLSPDFDVRHWWRYSEGVRDVVGEALAYCYARFFFWPER